MENKGCSRRGCWGGQHQLLLFSHFCFKVLCLNCLALRLCSRHTCAFSAVFLQLVFCHTGCTLSCSLFKALLVVHTNFNANYWKQTRKEEVQIQGGTFHLDVWSDIWRRVCCCASDRRDEWTYLANIETGEHTSQILFATICTQELAKNIICHYFTHKN